MEENNIKVLFVDDEENILSSIRRAMITEPYICYFAISGVEALKIMAEKKIDIIVSDMKMPNMSGLELMKKIKDSYPDTIKIILSGYAQLTQVIATVNNVDLYKFLLKPWKNEELYDTLNDASNYVRLLETKNKEFEKLETKNAMYQKLMNIKQSGENVTKNDIQNIKIIISRFFKNLNFLLSIKQDQNILSLAMALEKLYEVYIENLPTVISSYINEDLIVFLKSYKIDLETLGELSNTTYTGNVSLIKSLINELIDYLYILTRNNAISVTLNILEKDFEIRFKIPLGYILKNNENIPIEIKFLPRYIDLARDLMKLSGIDLIITNSESEIQIILTNEKK
ncbi:MAG TPA: hypothetical protein DCP90_04790 [Clostridiales bacterium]|nr:MAG: hypothetical protein A2Y22_06475 [Clostridiales bacterium GWD2_32_59]HAN09914.1 hypothetical protein [Clostridiales bacterium]